MNPYDKAVLVFSASGEFAGSFGRAGRGPGEFEGVVGLALGASDSIYVFDGPSRTLSVWSSSLRFVRSAALPLDPQIAAARTSQFLVFSAPIHTRELIGLPLHVVGADGAYKRSMGSASGLYRPDIPNIDRRAVAVSQGDTIWSGHRAEYVIDRIDAATGRTHLTLTRRVAWFPPGGFSAGSPSTDGEPYSLLVDVREDRNGLLWVLTALPDPAWRKAIRAGRGGDLHATVVDDHGLRDTMLEVFDIRRGVLLRSLRLDHFMHQFVADDLVASVEVTPAGEPRLQLWKFALQRP